LRGLGLLLVASMVVLYATGLSGEVPRLAFATWAGGAGLTLAGGRIVAAAIARRLRPRGLATPVLLAGPWAACARVRAHLGQHPELDRIVVGIAADDAPADADLPVRPVRSIAALALERGATDVLVCTRVGDQRLLRVVSDQLVDFPVEVHLVPDFQDLPLFCLRVGDLAGQPCLSLSASPLSAGDQLVKRIEDVALASLILLLIWPILLAVAVGVRLLNGPGPVLYVQRRHGFMGRTIDVYKFRSMTWSPDRGSGPEDVAEAPRAADREFLSPRTMQFVQTRAGDPRVTRFGRFLRSSSLDELPQFFNVLRGEMSLVGPRPHARRHNLEFLQSVPGLMRRLLVKPGITGLAQVSGARGRTADVDDMARRLAFDLAYIRRWSLWLDLSIIARTVLGGFHTREP
jgi:exopolysaccharide biosynthesis polyprenyl glycosylphosphotransferase